MVISTAVMHILFRQQTKVKTEYSCDLTLGRNKSEHYTWPFSHHDEHMTDCKTNAKSSIGFMAKLHIFAQLHVQDLPSKPLDSDINQTL